MIALGIVVPCFNEQAALPQTCDRLVALLRRLQADGKIGPSSRIYFVDDGSRDRTWSMIENRVTMGEPVAGIRLSRNRGHQNALLAGLLTAPGDALVSIDADLQDDVEAITSFSVVPLRVVTVLGLAVSLGSAAVIGWALWTTLVAHRALPGWASTVLPIYFLGGVQMLSLGIIGEYVGKIYLESKGRPRYFVERAIGFPAAATAQPTPATAAAGGAP